tara:strand:+ start:3388 stop:4638 length:1251 start_codon:yes stop_codon:yes gene_type:complete
MLNKVLLITIVSISSSLFSALKASEKIETINILMPAPFADSTKGLIKKFNDIKKGEVKVRVTRGPRETESVSDLAISSLILNKSPYDIILIDVTWLPKYAAAGWLEPFQNSFINRSWGLLAKGAQIGNKYKGKIYRWPLVADMGLLYWRKDLMKQAPTSPKELIDISLDLKTKKLVEYGFVWQGKQYEGLSCFFIEILEGFGGEWIGKNSEISLHKNNSIEAVMWMNELIKSGASPKAVTTFTETESLQVFESGKAAFMRNWPYAWAELQKSNLRDKVGVTTMVATKHGKSTSTQGSWGFSVIRGSKRKNQSFQLIEYLTSADSQKELFINYGYTPTMKSVLNNKELINSYPIIQTLNEALDKSITRPVVPYYAQLSDILQRSLSTVLTKETNIKSTMKEATRKMNNVISSYGYKE